MKVIKASELGVYLYCHRAWAFQRRGMVSQNQAALNQGTAYHRKHGSTVMLAGFLKGLAILLLILAAVVLAMLFAGWIRG
ncbi:MAG: hypothetical protein ABFD24_03840 [Anaerolineaceae bacterium]